MQAQTYMSGQISGQVPNQASSQLLGVSAHSGGSLAPQMQNLGGLRSNSDMDQEYQMKHQFIRQKIYRLFQQRQPNPEMIPRIKDTVTRVEQLLYRNAGSKEEYVNMETFEQRFLTVIRYLQSVNQSQKLARPTSSSSPVGTMIPTPGMGNTGNFNSTIPSSASDPMIVSAGVNYVHHNTAKTGQILPTTNSSSGSMHGSSFKPSNGSLTNGYEQSLGGTSFGSGGTNMIQSVMAPRIPGQMVPTPGMSNTQSSINSETSNSGRGFSGVESAMISQVRRSNQIGSQNRRMLQNLGGQASTVTASNLQQKDPPYGFSNGTLNGGLGLIGGNMMMSGPASSDSYLTGSAYGNSPMSVPQRGDQQQQLMPTISQQMMPLKSDGYSMNSDDLSGSRNLYRTVTSIRSSMDNQNMNPVSMQSNTNTNSLMINQANLHAAKQNADGKPQMLDHSCKTSSQSPHDQQYLSNFQQHTFHQNHNLQQQLFVQNQQKQQSNHHNQLLLENDSSRQSQLAPHLGSQVVPEHVMEFHNEVLHSEDAEQFELSELQHQNRVAEEHHRSTQMPSHQFGANNFPVSFPSQTSQHIHQMLQPQDLAAEPQNIFACFGGESQPQGQCHPQLQEKFITVEQSSNEQHIQNGVCQRISEQDAVEQPHLSSEGSIASQTALPSNTLMPQASTVAAGACNSTNPEKQFLDQRRWLLFLYHARNCSAPEGKCAVRNCTIAQKLLKHMSRCNIDQCPHQRCHSTRRLIQHFRSCRDLNCPLCIPLRRYIEEHRKARTLALSDTGPTNSMNGMRKSLSAGDGGRLTAKASISIAETSEDLQPSLKRMKMDHPSHSLGPSVECSPMQRAAIDQSLVTHDEQPNVSQHSDMQMASISKFMEDKNEHSATGSSTDVNDVKADESVDIDIKRPVDGPIISSEPVNLCKQESMNAEERFDQSKQESASVPEENAAGKSGKPKVKGVSLMELFTPEQIREHIVGLRQWVGQSKAKAEKNQAMEHSMDVNSCQLCAVEKLAFEPPPIYCTPCGARIKRNATFHTMGSGDTRHYFCTPCYNEARGDHIEVDGALIPKIRLEKKRNNEETEEGWVQCDKCELWQHQICALFNARRNDGGQAEYTCPNCYMVEVERGVRMPLPQSSVLGAKDLPRTILSDFIEHRLFRRLKQEKQERAFLLGKSTDEILGAEALVVRVVSSVDKKLEVKQRFLEIFQEVNYPSDFPYKSKVILLFQKIEGVEVCLFGMYVQEFGSESQYPNQRRVYLSYLDSVKYFRPDIKTATGEALRTYVYHEILIGYLEYCKNRGFTSCYIWACPPLKGEDYILYCHPEIQKTPKSDKLREWYLSMLRKASKESIVVELTNLYDHFFVSNGECKAKVTAARLPYFDGDYWPGAAEDMINQIQQEQDGTKQQKKGKTKTTISKRALKAAGQTDLSANASKDFLLMHKLGETISPMKEDFIMVHLQHSCSHCCHLMVSGNRWVCKQCKKFQLCDKCYDSEQKVEEREKHPINSRDKHSFHPIEIRDVPVDTKDPDDILESEFFDTRQAFLSLCQGNHYQYDTLRRAKHSSMMVLYHLHNPTAPAFVSNCHSCLQEIEAGQGWRCEICPDYDVCNACYQKGVDHPHMLTNHPSSAERDAQNTEARQIRVSQLRKMLDLLIHASQCKLSQCQYPHCRKVKGLFRHGMHCKTRASGGCLLCKRMWYLLQLHARTCKESACRVPRCKDLKEHLKRLNQQAESRRRAAVMEMMRQRAAEVAGNNG